MIFEPQNNMQKMAFNFGSVNHKNRKLNHTKKGLKTKSLTFNSKSFPQRHRRRSVIAFKLYLIVKRLAGTYFY